MYFGYFRCVCQAGWIPCSAAASVWRHSILPPTTTLLPMYFQTEEHYLLCSHARHQC